MADQIECVVVGAGAVGLAVARATGAPLSFASDIAIPMPLSSRPSSV